MTSSTTDPSAGDPTPADMVVVDVAAHGRFELRRGDDVLGYADYRRLADGSVEMPHTVISPAHRGQGLGDVLVGGAIEQLGDVTIVPACWFVADYLERHAPTG